MYVNTVDKYLFYGNSVPCDTSKMLLPFKNSIKLLYTMAFLPNRVLSSSGALLTYE